MKSFNLKVILFLLFLVMLVGGIFVYINLDPSYKVYNEALKLYEEGKTREAYKKVKEAMEINKLNRKAILLQAKLHKIVTSEDNYKKALILYRESLQDYYEKNYKTAIYKISNSYDLLNKIPSDAPIYDKAKLLMKKVERKIDEISKNIPNLFYEKALELSEKGRYVDAFEYLDKLDNKSEKIISLKSSLAYKIGSKRYAAIMSHQDDTTVNEISDAIYWLSNVDKSSPSYSFAQKQKKILEEILKNLEK
jgi:tetratricopeptide (TPR) repeat protein